MKGKGKILQLYKRRITMYDSKPWMQHYPEEIPAELEFRKEPVQQYLVNAATNFPAKIAIHFMGQELTYKELYDESSIICQLPPTAWHHKR